jgi:imidazolonepropionase-like amidohydrolase
MNRITAITNARIFDGERVIDERTVLIDGAYIQTISGGVPEEADVIDGEGATLMPGLIDSHVHTDMDGLRDALKFGVTTELEMMGRWSAGQRKKISRQNDIADLRSPGMGVTPKGGHPTEYMDSTANLLIRLYVRFFFPFVDTTEEAVRLVKKEIAKGADYVKIFIEDGSCIGFPGLSVLTDDIVKAAVKEAHRHDKLAVVHVTTAKATEQAISAGADGLGHLFFDRAHTPELIDHIASSGAFIIPTLVTISSALGNSATELANDERVSKRLGKEWLDSLSRSMNVFPQGRLEDAYAAIRALRDAGVDILAGSDVSEPIPILGGLAHGASLHHELQLLVAAGLKPIEALRAATSIPARRFGLTDRGRIVSGSLADLLLVDGDPLTNISDTLSICSVWHRGAQLQKPVS